MSPQTIARYIDILESTFMIRVLRPYYRNTKKRLVRSPKIDLVLERGTRTVAVEFKATSSPRVTKGFYLAAREINADERYIVAPLDQPDLIPYGDGAILCRPENVAERLLSASR